jgi:hypothetical protein
MHPHHHHLVHCHQLYWDPYPPRHLYWPGFWVYCDSYWYDYHVTDIAVVHNYVKDTYNMELVAYAISGDYMYALVNDPDGHTYLQVYDKNDKLLAEQQVSRKYKKMEVDAQNGGCWIMKKRDKDPLLFLYADGQLVADNFWNGKPMLVRLSDLVGKRVELKILPLGKAYPIYLQQAQRAELDQAPNGILLSLDSIQVIERQTNTVE